VHILRRKDEQIGCFFLSESVIGNAL